MSAEQIITSLLLGSTAVTDLAGTRIKPGVLPQGMTRPAVVLEHISGVPRHTLSNAEPMRRTRSRIQLTVLADSYPDQKALLRACADACNNRRGTIAGWPDVAVLLELEGPDIRNTKADATIYSQTLDFFVSFNRPAPA